VVRRHLLDSLSLLCVFDLLEGTRVLDVGSGAGFPGLPVKILRPEISITLLEPKEKRFLFLKNLVRIMRLEKISLRCQRAEEAGLDAGLREKFDLVLARAVARLDMLIPLCGIFLREGGVFVSYKGRGVEQEVTRASGAVLRVGAELQGVVPVDVPGISAQRNLVLMYRPLRSKGFR
jgi:16S rRNA (guanine527-N7)-methyltransferase